MNNQKRRQFSIPIFRNKATTFCLLFVVALFQLQCSTEQEAIVQEQEWQTGGEAYQDSWLETRSGNMPLVISAPHGGNISPKEIPDRECGTTVQDSNTTLLAFEIENAFKQYEKQPFLIVAQIARTKIDLNRDVEEATCGNSIMNGTWNRYHESIEEALAAAIEEFGYALYIDLHGQSHPIKRLELGYLLSKSDLKDNSDESEPNAELVKKSSLKNLLALNSELNIRELLTGENALGTLMENAGFPAVPSLDDPFPLDDEPYFTGGYNTRRYTSTDYPNVFGLQIEANMQGVRDSDENRKKFSEAFAQSMMDYIDFISN